MKIVAITGGRADWSILSCPLSALYQDPAFDLSLIVTGQHLATGEQESLAPILQSKIPVVARIDIDLHDNSPAGITRSTGFAVQRIAEALASTDPDMILILGDRYEILGAATAALLLQIPIIHLCGGDITEGAMDDATRHAISKMAHIHFVTNEDSRQRLLQMGEAPHFVRNVGNPGLDLIRKIPLVDKETLLQTVGLQKAYRAILVTCHSVTLNADPVADCRALLQALAKFGDSAILFTGANADQGGQEINQLLAKFVDEHQNAVLVESLGPKLYFSALKHFDVVAGNSSSGLYEAPSFQIPTVNIGDRQKGRLRAKSVFDCPAEPEAIRQAIDNALLFECKNVKNPYGNGDSSDQICHYLKQVKDPAAFLRKGFYSLTERYFNGDE